MDWGKAAGALLVVFGGLAWLIRNCGILLPRSPSLSLTAAKKGG